VVRQHRRQRLDEVYEVRVRGLQVLDDRAELLAFARREDARHLDVEGVAGEAVGGAERAPDGLLDLRGLGAQTGARGEDTARMVMAASRRSDIAQPLWVGAALGLVAGGRVQVARPHHWLVALPLERSHGRALGGPCSWAGPTGSRGLAVSGMRRPPQGQSRHPRSEGTWGGLIH
jgi:hypothetical protein